MGSATDTVEQYLRAFYAGDHEVARRYLSDHLVFSGPGASFRSADQFLRASAHAAKSVSTVQPHKVFVDGQDVAVFYQLVLNEAPGSIEIADWYQLDGEVITSILTILDTAPFTAGAGQSTGETAIDPVCHMSVQKASAAATRSHAGATFYFCNSRCAEAFEREPDAYVATLQVEQGGA
jgi:YHS domain-containing protein